MTQPAPPPPKDDPSPNPASLWPGPWMRWTVVALIIAGLLMMSRFGDDTEATPRIDYTTFYAELAEGDVERVELRGDDVSGTFSTGQHIDGKTITKFRTQLPAREDPALLPLLREKNVVVNVKPDDSSPWSQVLVALIPWVLIVGVWFWISRRTRSMLGNGKNPLAGMLGSTTKRFERQSQIEVRFDDVAGLDGAKRDLGEIIDFLKFPERFERMGGKMPRGALLVGSPGTGKTLLARAVAGEAGVPFFSITGSEFIELFVGVGASRVRELFEAAKAAAPAIIFIDEIDAVGRSRGTGLGGGHDEREQTLNQLLAAMDGFSRNDRIVVMAATNRPDVLDPALLRPGRFDRRIVVDLPERKARRAILGVHVRNKPLGDDVSLDDVAKATPGFSGADLANLVNEATLRAIRRGAEKVSADDFAKAHDKILLGEPRDTHLSPAERRRVAVHEAGHAVVAHALDRTAPLRRVSIVPRGQALGATQQTQDADTHLHTKSELEAKLAVLLGGYAAEQLLMSEVSSGAENDLRQASHIAHRMVGQLGMSDLGPIYHEHNTEHPFLGARIATDAGVSDATIHAIEREAQRLLAEALDTATTTLSASRTRLERLIAALLEQETLDQAELVALLDPTAAAPPESANPKAREPLAHAS